MAKVTGLIAMGAFYAWVGYMLGTAAAFKTAKEGLPWFLLGAVLSEVFLYATWRRRSRLARRAAGAR